MVESFGAFLCHEEGQVFWMFADRHAATLFKAWLAVMMGQPVLSWRRTCNV